MNTSFTTQVSTQSTNHSSTHSPSHSATLMSAQALQLDATDGLLFQDITFTLKLGDRIGLIGHNGCGKSTLLGLLSGQSQREATSGSLQMARACRMQHVEQHLPVELAEQSLYQALLAAVEHQPELHWRVDSLLHELGIDASTAQVPVKSLSGGEHTRLLLGRALLQDPNLLLLDEPSNHLDLPSLLWLEQFLRGWRGAFVLVSHDQRLLNNVTRSSWILRDQRLYCFDLPCSPALQALAEQDTAASARRAAEQKEIDRLAASSQRLAIWGRTYDNEDLARKAKTMQRRVEKLKDEQSFVTQGTPWRLGLHGKALAANQLLSLEKFPVRATPDKPVLFEADQLWLKPGDKIALLGANGAGKSSLLRQCWRAIQCPETPCPGLYYHPAADIGYYDQSLQQLPDQSDLMDALYPFATPDMRAEVPRRQALISAGFPYCRHAQKVGSLSGGERARLLFLALSLANYHLLFLDEPTNHLDMQGKAELAEALRGFAGGCLLVSHDRDLIEQSCNRFWVVQDGRLKEWQDAQSAYHCLFNSKPDSANAQVRKGGDNKKTGDDLQAANLDNHVDNHVDKHLDKQLERLCELEQCLADDLARKPKHQKPHLQQQWRGEIAELNHALGLAQPL